MMSETEFTKRVIEGHSLYSAHLSEERTIKVFLPPGYNRDLSYPTLYCHDGNEFFTHGRIATIATNLILEHKLSPLVIIGIAVNLPRRHSDYAVEGRRHEAYMRFVCEQCVPFVENTYAVSRDIDSRFMAGVSLGAVSSLDIHIEYPSYFRKLLMFSGAFYETMQAKIDAQRSLSELRAHMVVGRQETAVKTAIGDFDFYHLNQIAKDAFVTRGAEIEYLEADGEHTWGFWQRQLPAALAWLEQHRTNLHTGAPH